MHLGHWHHCEATGAALATHLHGRDLLVAQVGSPPRWHWSVTSTHGQVLAEGDASSCEAAEEAAERDVLAVHPPTDALLDHLLS